MRASVHQSIYHQYSLSIYKQLIALKFIIVKNMDGKEYDIIILIINFI